MTDDERLLLLHGLNVLADSVHKIATHEDADNCMQLHTAIDEACGGEYQCLRLIMLEHIFKRMTEVGKEIKEQEKTDGVYALEFAEGIVKIGRSKNFQTRLSMLKQQATSELINSRFFPCEKSALVETLAHRNFRDRRVKNEFFQIEFAEACAFLGLATLQQMPSTSFN